MHRMYQGGFHMDEQYEVFLSSRPVGKVQLIRQGLYCRVICRCLIPNDGVYRLYVQRDSGRENLGVVIPEGDGSFLDKRIPAKRIGEGKLHFHKQSLAGGVDVCYVPTWAPALHTYDGLSLTPPCSQSKISLLFP